ncbi:hypothetical protein [Aphanothece hegewaldii]|uniref:hypothetical protein n=1 Tax=Aphanothece hegewaldii TaxID=1521625 RepID=UPI0015E65A8C|nr:hypothetical protein [Aphanothece hegewaldii]
MIISELILMGEKQPLSHRAKQLIAQMSYYIVKHKLALLRETYEMLNNIADTKRATALE